MLLLLLLLFGVLAVALVLNAFLRLALLALGAVLVLVMFLAINKTLVVLVPTVPLCFYPSGLGTLASVVFSAALPCSLVATTAANLGHAGLPFAGVHHRWPQSQLGPVVADL